MVSSLRGSRVPSAARPALTLLAVLLVATSVGGCWRSPRFQAPFTLVKCQRAASDRREAGRGDARSSRLSRLVGAERVAEGQGRQLSSRIISRKAPIAADQGAVGRPQRERRPCALTTRCAWRCAAPASIRASVALEPYFGNGDPSAPVRLSYLQVVAVPPDCPDWSENIGRDPQNMPWPNKGCATQRNLAAMVANPRGPCSIRAARRRVQANAAMWCGANTSPASQPSPNGPLRSTPMRATSVKSEESQ